MSESTPDHAGVLFHPPLVVLGSMGAGWFLRRWVPLRWLPSEVAQMAGVILAVSAMALFVWAVVTMHRAKTSVPTHTPTTVIVRRGPYRFTRNPIYLSMVLVLVAGAVKGNSLWFLGLAAASAALLTWGVIVREERYLEGKFGEEYLDFKRRVRRWV